ncbi:MAG: flagellar basal body rod protein FlgB [Rhodocyclaceae bacterium]|nr:flagellar basal body rod protein FlgB [Rhodocyclaceae bacterium]MBX3670676.1 flagellar basal body rod protein FlgB [Rhodocyclaceae bacterium]
MVQKFDQALKFHQTALGLRAFRQQLVASNIANADTPQFKAKDIDFPAALADALAGRSVHALPVLRTDPRHLAPAEPSAHGAEALYRGEYQSSIDGNTVNLDVERAVFAQNTVHYEAGVNFVNGVLRSLQQAIQGQ